MIQSRLLLLISAALAVTLGLGAGSVTSAPADPTPTPTPVAQCAFDGGVQNYDVRIERVPSPPGQSGVTLRVSGISADGCVPTSPRAEVVAGGIVIHAVETSCSSGPCPSVLTPWSFDVAVPDLPPGPYSAELVLQCGDKSFQCAAIAIGSADVTTTPTPAPADTATPVPLPTTTPLPPTTPTPPPTAMPTPVPTATATPFVCDESVPGSVCDGIVSARVFLDLRCDRFFNPGTDALLGNARVTAHLPDGTRRTATTNRLGDIILTGIHLPPGGSIRLVSDRPDGPWWATSPLAACPGGAELTLTADDFGPLGIATVDFRWALGE